MIKRILVVGGANGIGLSIAVEMASRASTEKVYIVDKAVLADEYKHHKIESFVFDLTNEDYNFFDLRDAIISHDVTKANRIVKYIDNSKIKKYNLIG